jgi:hypothetical protein
VWIGNYEHDEPTPEAIAAFVDLTRWLVDTGRLVPGTYPTGGHRDVGQTACPGSHLYAAIPDLRELVAAPPDPIPVEEDHDMLIISGPGRPGYLLSGGRTSHLLDFAQLEAIRDQGDVRHVVVSDEQVDRFLSDFPPA